MWLLSLFSEVVVDGVRDIGDEKVPKIEASFMNVKKLVTLSL
jgi:hypothetical protein